MEEIKWYSKKIGKKFEEFDEFDKYITDVLKEFVKEQKEQLILSGVVKRKEIVNNDTTEYYYPDGKIIGSL